MKKVFLALAFLLVFVVVKAQTNFFKGTWKEAAAKAAAENKYLFVDCFTDWCYWCKVADKETFPDQRVGDFLNENFVAVQVDMEREGVYLGMKYRVTGYPSFLVFTPSGDLALKLFGYNKDNADFIKNLRTALDPSTHPSYPSKVTDQIEFPDFYKNSYISKNGDQKKRVNPEIKDISKWLAGVKDLTSEQAWSVIYKFNVGEKAHNSFLENLDTYKSKYGE